MINTMDDSPPSSVALPAKPLSEPETFTDIVVFEFVFLYGDIFATTSSNFISRYQLQLCLQVRGLQCWCKTKA